MVEIYLDLAKFWCEHHFCKIISSAHLKKMSAKYPSIPFCLPLTPIIRPKFKIENRPPKLAPTDASWREDSNGGIASALGPKLRFLEAKNYTMQLLRMRRRNSSKFLWFFAPGRRNFGPIVIAIPPSESSRRDASVSAIFECLSPTWIFDLITGVNGGQNGMEGYLVDIFWG